MKRLLPMQYFPTCCYRRVESSNGYHVDEEYSYLPVVLGGVDQLRSIWSTARVHSVLQAVASFSTPAAVGVRPPHMVGLAAMSLACFAIKFLYQRIR